MVPLHWWRHMVAIFGGRSQYPTSFFLVALRNYHRYVVHKGEYREPALLLPYVCMCVWALQIVLWITFAHSCINVHVLRFCVGGCKALCIDCHVSSIVSPQNEYKYKPFFCSLISTPKYQAFWAVCMCFYLRTLAWGSDTTHFKILQRNC